MIKIKMCPELYPSIEIQNRGKNKQNKNRIKTKTHENINKGNLKNLGTCDGKVRLYKKWKI